MAAKVLLHALDLAFARVSRRHRQSTGQRNHDCGEGSASSRLSRHSPLLLCNCYVLSVAQECRQIAAGGSFGNTRPIRRFDHGVLLIIRSQSDGRGLKLLLITRDAELGRVFAG